VAQSLAEFVCEQIGELEARHERVRSIRVRIGVMAGITPIALKSAFRQAILGTALQSCELQIDTVDLVVWCSTCKAERLLDDLRQLRCPVCQNRTRQVVQGQELEIASIEVVNTDAAAATGITPIAAANPASPPANPQAQ
jgi:hydrogenase nickel incorporation protein HypA/HybF